MTHYRPQRSWGKVMFSQASVILLMGGVSASVHAWIHPPWEQTPPPPPGADTPPWSRHHPPPPGNRHTPPRSDTPQEQTPPPRADTPREQTPPPPAEHAVRYGQRAGGTHPTGMQSCFYFIIHKFKLILGFCSCMDNLYIFLTCHSQQSKSSFFGDSV